MFKIKQIKSLVALAVATGYFFVAITQGFVIASATASAIEAADAQAVNNPEGTFPYIKTFLISGYYTPLPDQTKYATGSYETDVRLNGEGVWAADGTTVYPGLIAAPSNFPFGTKMNIPGIGIGAVHDRGGAIKNSRLDVWMGSGEVGLARALAWGLRSVDVTVYGIDENIKESMDIPALPQADLNRIIDRISSGTNVPQTKYFRNDASNGDEGEHVRSLQIFLKKAGYFDGIESGYFDNKTETAVISFQLAEKIIDGMEDPGAGSFGPRSRATLERLLSRGMNAELGRLPDNSLKLGDSDEAVTHLQNTLKNYGFLQEVTGVFDQTTINALKKFQLDYGIIDNLNAYGAGHYGPKTQEGIRQLITDYYTPATGASSVVAQNPHAKFLALNDRGPEVELLQSELKRLNFFGLEPNGYYGKTTEHAVFKFQQAFNIVEDANGEGAGSAGPQTLAQLNKLTGERGSQVRLIAQTMESKEIIAERIEDESKLLAGVIAPESFVTNLRYGMRSGEVERLQSTLKRLGFFPGRMTTEYFGDITQQSLSAFQKSHNLPETGALDDSTRNFINRIVVST